MSLTLIFVLLKLYSVIYWPWWVVFLPLIIEGSLGVILLVLKIVLYILNRQINRFK